MHAALQVLQEILQQTAVQREATISSDADGRGVTEDEQCAALKVLEVLVRTCPMQQPWSQVYEEGLFFRFNSTLQSVAM